MKSFGKPKKHGAKAKLLGKPKSKALANVAGYEKRKAKRGGLPSRTGDIYEHVPEERGRRSTVGLDLDKDEAMDFGGLDGDEDEREELRARLIGETVDDEQLDSGDDEEIDSDDAFDEADDHRFAGFFSAKRKGSSASKKGKRKAAVRFAEVDLNEDDDESMPDSPDQSRGDQSESEEEEEEEELGDEDFIDLIDVLDGKGEIDMGDDNDNEDEPSTPQKPPAQDDDVHSAASASEHDSDEDSESGDDSESDDEDQIDIAPSDDDIQDEALDQLQQFVSQLDPTSKKRKAQEDSGDSRADQPARKRRVRQVEKTEAGAESEFRVNASGQKLQLDDLLAPLESQSSTLQSLKKTTKILTSNSSKAKTLAAPLPTRTQERLDRAAAYEATKKEVDKWNDTVKRIKEAEHLSFPLQAPSAGRVSNIELAAKFKPRTEMESAIDALLKSSKLREEDLEATEDNLLKMNNLSVEEIAERRAELRKMRDLVFRAEIKARRMNKIKSKTYRRIKRKEKEKLAALLDQAEGGGDEEEDEEKGLKREYERAKERATLKHKHTGKWAKQMRGRDDLDGETRKDIEDMLSRGEQLRRRIQGVGSGESDDSEEEDDEEDDGLTAEERVKKIKQDAFDELQQLAASGSEAPDAAGKPKSVFQMKFMKDAMARKEHAMKESIDALISELGENGQDQDSDQGTGDSNNHHPSVITERRNGRFVIRPGVSTAGLAPPSQPLPSRASDTSSVTLRSTDLLSPPPPSPSTSRRPTISQPLPTSSDEANPWLVRADEHSGKVAKQRNEVLVSKDSKAAEKSKHKLQKQTAKKGEVVRQAADDAVVAIDPDVAMKVSATKPPNGGTTTPTAKDKAKDVARTGPRAQPGTSMVVDQDDDDDDDANSEVDAQEAALTLKGKRKDTGGLKAFEQRDLVAMAFAGDNVVQSFEEAKKREMASDGPKTVDTTIPGWGSWGGAGVRKTAPRPERLKTIAGVDPKSRADYNKKHVIISEKKDKKASKYLIKDLPYPYTSKAQFERAMDQPLGTEWNTRVAFQRATLPRVVKKPGVVITPLEKLS